MRFWDSSALVSLVLEEADSAARERDFAADPEILVWYASAAEIESAICRRVREGGLAPEEADRARVKWDFLASRCFEVQAFSDVRLRAVRLLRLHALRAADAFQLAAALVVFEERTKGNFFHSGDARLLAAARAEGFLAS